MPQFTSILPMHLVVALALPNTVAFDLSIPAQVFGHPDQGRQYSFAVCASSPGEVPTTSGFSLQVAHGLELLAAADTIIVPGFSPLDEPAAAVLEHLLQAAMREARVVSVCTGAFALAAAGLLDGLRATTHWRYAQELGARYPAVDVDPDVLYIDHGQIATSAGIAAGIDLCLHLVRRDFGADAAARVARRMVVAPHRDGGQAQFLERPILSGAPGMSMTCQWALSRLAEPLTVTEMARHAGWAPRTFARRFVAEVGTTPLRWLTSQRLAEARRLLERTDLPIEQVAAHSGLGTAANLRLHFARELRTTPTAYRNAWQVSRPLAGVRDSAAPGQ
jgi:transcriptional regulator GlxA family with amidase domain